jgi:hypothetical protein
MALNGPKSPPVVLTTPTKVQHVFLRPVPTYAEDVIPTNNCCQ